MFNSKCKHCGDPKKGHYAGPAKCKNCGRPKEGCSAWVKKNPSALFDLCYSSSKPDMNELNALIQAGIDIRWKVRRN